MVKVSVFDQPPWKQDIGASQCLDFLIEIIDYNLLKQQPSNSPVLTLGVSQVNEGKLAPWWKSALSECFASPSVWNRFLKSHFCSFPSFNDPESVPFVLSCQKKQWDIFHREHHKLKTSRGWTFFVKYSLFIKWYVRTAQMTLKKLYLYYLYSTGGGGGAWIPKWTEFPPNTSLRDRLRLSTPPSRRAPRLVTHPF